MYPLDGVRVVALEQAVAAPLCTRHLADLGAEVIKVERPDGGDFARRYDGVVNGESAHFVWLNRGKRSVVLDLRSADDRDLLDRLLKHADVFVHNLGPGAVDRLGWGWQALHARRPRLISCGISGYGVDGPYRGRKAFDLLLQGESGLLAVTGSPEQPAKVGISIADIGAGMYAFSAILAALLQRGRTGEGVFIDISMLDCLTEWMSAHWLFQAHAGQAPARAGMRHATIVPYGPFRVGDGSQVNLAVQNEGQWRRLCTLVLGHPEWVDEPQFRTNALRHQHRADLEQRIESALAAETRASLEAKLEQADIPFGALNSVADVLQHRQLQARMRWFQAESPSGPFRAIAHPLNLQGMPLRSDSVPRLGEHTEDVRREYAPSAGQH